MRHPVREVPPSVMLLLLRALLLWSLISIHVVGGAAVFRRLFPKESPWFGFVVPCLGLVILLNFIEHLVAVPTLLWLLPFTGFGSIWAISHPGLKWQGFRLPTGIFLASFAFTLAVRSLHTDITALRDGIVDLGLLSSFCMGQRVPPPIAWYPELPLSHYYVFGHYAISVLIRLLGLDVGTGFNLSIALMEAFDLFFAAAAAWCISRQKVWITLLGPILMAGAATGATAYLLFTTHNFNPNEADDLFSGLDNPDSHSPLLKLLHDGCRHELVPPGAWIWIGYFHSSNAGLFLVLFFVWSLAEALRRKATNWPWICLGALPMLTTVTSSWALPLEGVLLLGALFGSWYYQFFPRNFRFVILSLGLITLLMAPTLLEFLTTGVYLGGGWTDENCRMQLVEFLVLWWPIYLPMMALVFVWPKLAPVIKVVMLVLPITVVGMDLYNVGNPYDWSGKLWGYVYGVGWITLLPAVLRRRAIVFRLVSLILIVSSLCSFWAWTQFCFHDDPLHSDDLLHLEGTGSFRSFTVQNREMMVISRLKGAIILSGQPANMATTIVAIETGNWVYVSGAGFVDGHLSGVLATVAEQPGFDVRDFYDGKCANPLLFLRTHDIAAVVISPEDQVSTDVVDTLKKKLSPYYEYIDCRDDDDSNPGKKLGDNAGVFFFHPEMMKWPLEIISPPPDLSSPAASPAHSPGPPAPSSRPAPIFGPPAPSSSSAPGKP